MLQRELRLAVLCLGAVAAASASANPSTRCTPISANVVRCRIEEPEVKRASTDYPAVPFKPYDRVTITAGGCVQTGGSGRTWKRYVNPSGPNSDRLYHGLLSIPGATAGMVRFANVINQTVTVPGAPPGPWYLRLGYEDDGYGDNGYWGHDDGTQDQCKNVGAAWVELTIQHNCAPGQLMCGTVCVNPAVDGANCGGCGVVCSGGQTCQAGRCACPGGGTFCGGRCVNTATDGANCGACGVVCSGGQLCQAGRCACPAGTTLCGGRCVNLATDGSNCGACGAVCAGGKTCQGGACACPSGTTECNGQCFNLQTDRNHCGNCVRVCDANQSCTNGVCQ